MIKQIVCVVLVFCAFQFALIAQQRNLVAGSSPEGNESVQTPPDYVIGPEDVLSIVVWKEPDLTNRVIVRPDGKIGMPLLNDVQAAGLTPRELQQKLTDGLKKYVSGPSVSVIVAEIKSNVAFVTGSVNKPGPYVLGAPTTVMELLIRAGGLTEFAKSEEVQVLRNDGVTRRFRFNYKQFSEGRDYKQNIQVRRGDIIIVP